jgi:hypothetical protein
MSRNPRIRLNKIVLNIHWTSHSWSSLSLGESSAKEVSYATVPSLRSAGECLVELVQKLAGHPQNERELAMFGRDRAAPTARLRCLRVVKMARSRVFRGPEHELHV